MELTNPNYRDWLADWKTKIQSAQIKAALHVNAELLSLYWEFGRDIVAQQQTAVWGEGLIPRLAKDLKSAFPHLTGFSTRNLFYIRKWFLFYREELQSIPQIAGQSNMAIVPQLVAQIQTQPRPFENDLAALFFMIPWGHHRHILDKCSDLPEAAFYLKKTLQNNWSRDALRHQMKQNLYERQGKAITNFEWTLPKPQSDLAHDTLKNPYNFDFLNIGEEAQEREVEAP
ncbi:MAG: DUF1016 N-terminal domain-containing protein [Saprospiraceae bacterium]